MDVNGAFTKKRVVTLNVTAISTTPKRKTRKRAYLPRKTRRFQLRNGHPQDIHVTEILDYARSERREVTMIRDAIQLYYALEQGNLEVLFEKFPQYKALFDTTAALTALAENMRTASGQQPDSAVSGGLKPLPGFKALAMPVFDDDEPLLAVRKGDGGDSAANFVRSIGGLVH